MKGGSPKPVLIRQVNLRWYPVTLVPLATLLPLVAYGYLSPLAGVLAIFLLFFWLFSFGFAVYSKFRKPKEPRQ